MTQRFAALRRQIMLSASLVLLGWVVPWSSANTETSPPEDLGRIAAARFDWASVPEIYPGLRHVQFTISAPRPVQINALRVDTFQPDLRFITTKRHSHWGKPMPAPIGITYKQEFLIRTGRQRTRDFLLEQQKAGLNMAAAINASPWHPWSELGFWRLNFAYADELGLLVSDGDVVDTGNGRPSLIIRRDGTVRMEVTQPDTDTSEILQAVSGFGLILEDGVARGTDALAPRTGYGLCQDARFLILLTADGRQEGISEGVGLTELGQLLHYLGAWTGINMDGGGSTTMVLRDPENAEVQVVNRPSAAPRAVASNLGIYYHSEPEETPSSD